MKPISIELISNVITLFGQCPRCRAFFQESGLEDEVNKSTLSEYPPEFTEDFARLSDWVQELERRYGSMIYVRLIDAKSPLGLYKALVHRFRTYPAFIVEKKDVVTGWNAEKLDSLLDARLNG
jgi:hypothetical protein